MDYSATGKHSRFRLVIFGGRADLAARATPKPAHFAKVQHEVRTKPFQAGYSAPSTRKPAAPGNAGQIAGPSSEHPAGQPGKGGRLDLQRRQAVLLRGADVKLGQAGPQAFKQMQVESAATADNQLLALFFIAAYARHTSAGS